VPAQTLTQGAAQPPPSGRMDQMAAVWALWVQNFSQQSVRFEMACRLRTYYMSSIEGRWAHSPNSASADLRSVWVVLSR
jgi:hypothetical protein